MLFAILRKAFKYLKKFLDDVHYRFTMIVDDQTISIGSMHLVLLDVMNFGCC